MMLSGTCVIMNNVSCSVGCSVRNNQVFLGKSKRLYNSLRLLVGLLVCPSVSTMKFLNLLTSKSGYFEIASPSRLVLIILVFVF
jgi:hypothetical protein